MSAAIKNSMDDNYFSGGLAELIPSPSRLTYSFLAGWFTGKGSVGHAMKLLRMPYQKINLPILELIDGELLVNLKNEEQTLYQNTIFTYKKQKEIHYVPKLTFEFVKIFNPVCLLNTIKIIWIQSKWIAKPELIVTLAKECTDSIPDELNNASLRHINETIQNHVLPNVITVGILSEFYNQLAVKEAKGHISKINKYISNKIAKNDWFFLSMEDQTKVKKKHMTFEEFIKKYGLRADKDYELTCPRWYEIPEIIHKRIEKSQESIPKQTEDLHLGKQLQHIVDTSIQLQLLRSEAKRKALLHFDRLRQSILHSTKGIADISQLTKEDVLNGTIPQKIYTPPAQQKIYLKSEPQTSGKGTVVSQGHTTGTVKYITDNETDIPEGTIGVFPNASPEFSIQYPKCAGMIFLKGGQTSHGAIVAREFGIPAIIDNQAQEIENNSKLELNAITGEWHII